MPPRSRRATAVPIDLDELRSRLTAGRPARVQVAASAQFPTGARGLVRRIGDPAVDGDEFVFVEVSVGGTKDTLPFAPSDLSAPGVKAVEPPGPAPVASRSARTGGVRAMSGRPPARDRPAPAEAPVKPAVAAVAEPAAAPSRTARPPAAKRLRRVPVTITLSTTGEPNASWSLEATVGARKAVKATPLTPARVWELVKSLDNPPLSDLVGSQLADYRRATEERANQLSAQLADLVAELKSLPDGDSLTGK